VFSPAHDAYKQNAYKQNSRGIALDEMINGERNGSKEKMYKTQQAKKYLT